MWVGTLPGLPPSFNVYDRWSREEKLAKRHKWQKDAWSVMNGKGNSLKRMRGRTPFERCHIRSVLFFRVARSRDADNFSMPLRKWLQDTLVSGRILVDDTHDRCTWAEPGFVVGAPEISTLVTLELSR